jgi:hypothetical protein
MGHLVSVLGLDESLHDYFFPSIPMLRPVRSKARTCPRTPKLLASPTLSHETKRPVQNGPTHRSAANLVAHARGALAAKTHFTRRRFHGQLDFARRDFAQAAQ